MHKKIINCIIITETEHSSRRTNMKKIHVNNCERYYIHLLNKANEILCVVSTTWLILKFVKCSSSSGSTDIKYFNLKLLRL